MSHPTTPAARLRDRVAPKAGMDGLLADLRGCAAASSVPLMAYGTLPSDTRFLLGYCTVCGRLGTCSDECLYGPGTLPPGHDPLSCSC